MTHELCDKLGRLQALLREMESMVVAFSAGVDSTLLLRVVAGLDGVRHLALTTDSPTNIDEDITEARQLADRFGSPHLVVKVDELLVDGYAANPPNRCYLCKETLYPLCWREARRANLAFVVDGVNVDDLGDYRPGLHAAREQDVRHPLAESGLHKSDVRTLSAHYGLPTADKPASPCLSSRFPYGTRITHERLTQVARSEAVLRALGFRELRVRHLGHKARVEIAAHERTKLDDAEVGERIRQAIGEVGFDEVEIASEPLRSGSLNDALSDAARASHGRREDRRW